MKLPIIKVDAIDQQEATRRMKSLLDKHGVSIRATARQTGFSVGYCADLFMGRRNWSEKLMNDFETAIKEVALSK